MYCRRCGSNLDDDAVICPNCGVPTDKYYATRAPQTMPGKKNGVALAGFIVSLVSTLFGYMFCIISFVALGLSIAGMANRKNCNEYNNFATAGLVISIITTLFWLLFWIFIIVLAITTPEYIPPTDMPYNLSIMAF